MGAPPPGPPPVKRPKIIRSYYAGALLAATLYRFRSPDGVEALVLRNENFSLPVNSIEDADRTVLHLMSIRPAGYPQPPDPYENDGFAVVYQITKLAEVEPLPHVAKPPLLSVL